MACDRPENKPSASETVEQAVEEQGGTIKQAIKALDEKIAKNPNDPELYATKAAIYYRAKAYDETIRDIQKAISLDSVNAEYPHLLADAYLDYYKSKKAIKTLEDIVKQYPTRILTLLKLAEFQHILQQFPSSMATIDKILKQQPSNDEAYYMLGRNFKAMGDTTKAMAGFRKAVSFNSDHIDAYLELGILSEQSGNDLALDYFNNAIRIDSTDITALYGKAYFLQNRNRFNEAIAVYRKLILVDRDHIDAHFNTAILYLEMDSLSQAYKGFDITIRTEPTFARGYYYRGLTAEKQGNIKKALKDYQQTLVFDPNFGRAEEALLRLEK